MAEKLVYGIYHIPTGTYLFNDNNTRVEYTFKESAEIWIATNIRQNRLKEYMVASIIVFQAEHLYNGND